MRLEIDFIDETSEIETDAQHAYRKCPPICCSKGKIEEGTELSVTFVDNERIQEINKEYRNKDAATDVISFAMEEMGEDEMKIIGGDIPRVLGDIIISI